MKTKLIGLALALGFLTSCEHESIKASNSISTTEYSFTGYNSLELSSDFEAFIEFSDTTERIEIEANENLQNKIIVSQEGSTLKIRLKNNISVRGNVTLKAYIKVPEISNFKISGDSSVEFENVLFSDNVSIEARGDSRVLGEIETTNLFLEISGDSSVDLYGISSSLNADLRGDSSLKDFDLAVEDLIIDLSGDSYANISVSKTIDIQASGDSELNYKGHATIINQRLRGDAKIRNRD